MPGRQDDGMTSSEALKERYKNTVQLPKTEFPMRANLSVREPETLAKWKVQKLYQKIQSKNQGRENFSMSDGPPYANGNIHLGTVLNKVLKDFVIKYQNMAGRWAPFVPGWDCHGLPIEHKVTKELGPKRQQMSKKDIRELCRSEALKWVSRQMEQFIRLGVLADWENPYLTLNPDYEAEEIEVLADILKNGVLYRGEKPVYWCPTLQTALAEAEVEYQQHRSPSIYVKFEIDPNQFKDLTLSDSRFAQKLKSNKVYLVIWTTTPWTLPANVALCVHPDFEYGFFQSGEEILLVAKNRSEILEKEWQIPLHHLHDIKGSDLENKEAQHPFLSRKSLIVLGQHVTLEAGTGVVHTAPGHGLDDYSIGLKYNLPILSPVDDQGRFTEEVPEYKGIKIFDANSLIVDRLKASGHLIHQSFIEHSYPHNWRSKTPLIFRATPQWFIRMDDPHYNIREKALSALEKEIDFVPEWGAPRLRGMLENRPDWCISRQRVWGVPIPVFYCSHCKHTELSEDSLRRVAKVMRERGGIEGYFELPIKELLGDDRCPKCQSSPLSKGEDILDVWFDSGVCFAAVQGKRDGLSFPAEIYLEGSDQHRGWFQTSLLASIASKGIPPFKKLVTHGFVVDQSGRKMSKSLGNVTEPEEVIQRFGAEILRLWVAHEDYGQDVNFGPEMLDRLTETYRRWRNTLRFMLGNLNDFDTGRDRLEIADRDWLDQWIMHEYDLLIEKVAFAYENFEFHKVYHGLNQFFTVTLSAVYLDILKDRLYTAKKDGKKRRSSQSSIYDIVAGLIQMMAPILSFLSEEAYEYLPGRKEESVFLSGFPRLSSARRNDKLSSQVNTLLLIRSEVAKTLEVMRQRKEIGSSLESCVVIYSKDLQFELLRSYEASLREFFIVSSVELCEGEFEIKASKAQGTKCVRCWNYDQRVGETEEFPGVCPKCVEALK